MNYINRIKLTSYIGFTQLWAKKTQTIVAIAGVTFGIAVFIFLLGCVKGVNQYITELSLEQCPDIRLFNETNISEDAVLDRVHIGENNIVHHPKPKNILLNLRDAQKTIEKLNSNPAVKAVSGIVKSQVYYNFGSSKINGEITGINYEDENKLLDLESKFVAGDSKALSHIPNSLVMGKKLAARLNLNIGDKIVVTTDKGFDFIATLSGIIKIGIPDQDKTICYVNTKTVQTILSVPSSYITDINIKLYDRSLAPAMAQSLVEQHSCSSSDWLKDNPLLFEGDELNDIVFKCIAASILLVAGFGIFNILNMMIYEKMKDIAIIKALGFSDNDVRMIFMIQALTIGFIGAILGLLIGLILSWLATFIPFESEYFLSLDHLPMCFNILYYILGLLFGLLTTSLAGYLPSRKASRLDPITILRG
ncbi:lipoprotein-releasing system permease protein [Dysgonomonas alginatilytica]|uniref:Lipoprotein-releasing system permease protein n=1 Tax=Dysgonomonas alginatilytica TaxID=1605892 RepID=A0A2V3PLU5_9BACT|nr:FtsX-like permease family protein [Dysgonomonas alginatilytica]PXV61115.1 lipoprotein-releasing system permease protein [Dysgonomonas alginatilytica]